MKFAKVWVALAMMVLVTPASAQISFDDIFGPPPKPKPKPVKRPPAAQQPVPVQQPAATTVKPAPAPGTPSTATGTAPAKPAATATGKPPASAAPGTKAAAPGSAVPAATAAKPAAAPTAKTATPAPAAPAAPAKTPAVTPAAVKPAAVNPVIAPAEAAPVPAAKPAAAPVLAAPSPAAEPPAGAPAAPATKTAALHSSYVPPPPAKPSNCKNTGNFPGWLAEFRKEASAEGVSQSTISDVLDDMTLDQGIIYRDRGGQKVFTQSFYDFSNKLANPSRLKSSIFKHNKHKALFQRAEEEYGVPGPVLTAFWALESDFGTGMGNLPILRSLATLAYDCRRGEMFRVELMSALKLIDRGDMTKEQMVGSWAGEIGQTQFLPSHVLRYAIDYDGDGRSDLFRNNADIIGTSAKFVADLGWRRGEPWLQEVKLTAELPWQEADLAIKHPITQWSRWGVTQIDGTPLPEGNPEASLVLPMGRRGPALLAYPNFDVYLKWNQSLVYALTAAHMATRIMGAPPLHRGSANIPMLDPAQVKELQTLLNRRGWNVGEADGKLGAGTRSAVKQAQIKFRMPADSYPTVELLSALRSSP